MSQSLRLLALLARSLSQRALVGGSPTLVRRAPLSYTLVAIAVVASSVTVVDMVLLPLLLLHPDDWRR